MVLVVVFFSRGAPSSGLCNSLCLPKSRVAAGSYFARMSNCLRELRPPKLPLDTLHRISSVLFRRNAPKSGRNVVHVDLLACIDSQRH